jgi:large subunit ribosomal protein L18
MHVRRKVFGTAARPRLSVYRSHRHFHCQVIDDADGRTLAAASTLQKDVREKVKSGGNVEAARIVGKKIAEQASGKGIRKVVFDRNFYRFHGRVRAFAEEAAKGGLDFLGDLEKVQKKRAARKAAKGKKAKQEKKGKKEGGKKEKKQKQKQKKG